MLVITTGCFSLGLTPGHTFFLRKAKKMGISLIVCLNQSTDHKNISIYSVEERAEILQSCSYVDYVLPFTTEIELAFLIEELKLNPTKIIPDLKGYLNSIIDDVIFVKGDDYTFDKFSPEVQKVLKEYDIPYCFIPGTFAHKEINYSTSEIVKRIRNGQ